MLYLKLFQTELLKFHIYFTCCSFCYTWIEILRGIIDLKIYIFLIS